MPDDHPTATYPAAIIDAFSGRELSIVDLWRVSPTAHVVEFDLADERLHLLVDEAAPANLVLELAEAHPLRDADAVALALEVANELHDRIHHVRFVVRRQPVGDATAARRDAGALTPASVHIRFTAPLFGPDLAGACRDAFDVGVDALFYALDRIGQVLAEHGVAPHERESRA